MKYFLILPIMLLSQVAFSQQYYDTHNVRNNDDYFITQWRKFKNSITNYNLELANLVPMDSLLKGINITPQYEKGTDLDRTNVADHHSSIDVWKLKTQVNSDFFNMRDIIGVNVEIGKEVIYIQQFKKKIQSILRMPYNPLNKIPLKSEMFFKKDKNDAQNLLFKEGDLLVFNAPMILSLNKANITNILSYIHSGPGLTYGLAGVFNIQVFRMKNNFVRVTISNSLSKTIGINFGINILDTLVPGYYILGFDALGKIVTHNLFDSNLIQFSQATTHLANHTYDFIFNLNSEDARKEYDSLMGPKLNLFNGKNYEVIKRLAGIYKTKDQISKNLEMNFKDLVKMSDEDINLPPNQRRIITMNQGESRSHNENSSFQFNLMHFFKYRETESKTKALGQTFASRDHAKESYTFVNTSSSSAMDSFFKWRSRERKHTNIIFENDENNKPKTFKFLHKQVYEEDRYTKQGEFERFKKMFLSDLPEAVSKNIVWPDWYKDVTKRRYATLKKQIFISDKIFKSGIVITEARIRAELKKIIKIRKSLKSESMLQKSLLSSSHHSETTDVQDYIDNIDTLSKYQKEIDQLPSLLGTLFNGIDYLNNDINQFKYFTTYISKAPLLYEIGLELILKSMSEDDLKKVAYISIYLATDNVEKTHFQFPNNASSGPLEANITAYKDYVSYSQILGQFNFINDKSYRMWLYFNRDGSIIDLNQIVSK